MNNLSTLFQKIEENPTLYLGKPSITCLHLFLIGYLSTRYDMGLDQEGTEIEGFQKWIQERKKTRETHSWAGIILFCTGNERSAFYEFFKLFEEFVNQDEKAKTKRYENSEDSSINVNNLSSHLYDLYELLEQIKKRPGMYLGTSSITNLHTVLTGYSLARREVGLAPTKQEREFEGFQAWLQKRYEIKSNQSWAKIILFYSMDEKEALEKFFELFEEYLNRDENSAIEEDNS